MATLDELTNEQKMNSRPLFCRHCGSQFISTDKAERTEHKPSQTHFQKLVEDSRKDAGKKEGGNGSVGDEKSQDAKEEVEIISSLFWKVPDVWDFDNIGQTRVVESPSECSGFVAGETVYVVCADCEREPVGVRWRANEPYYVSHSRVLYEKPEGAPENGALPPGMSEEYIRGLIAQQQAVADLATEQK
mmetsp:Transcript_5867/g.8299  ORF Transcript_5867/g.8299 Transcript_5867/m.8299 type:complete len:189 (-) Transcript_5867:1100-1666(-)